MGRLNSLTPELGISIARKLSIPDRVVFAQTCKQALVWYNSSFDAESYNNAVPHRLIDGTDDESARWRTLVRECYQNGVRLHQIAVHKVGYPCELHEGRGEPESAEKRLMRLATYGHLGPVTPDFYKFYQDALAEMGREDEAAVFNAKQALSESLYSALAKGGICAAESLFEQGAQFDVNGLGLAGLIKGRGSLIEERLRRNPDDCRRFAEKVIRQPQGHNRLEVAFRQCFQVFPWSLRISSLRGGSQGQISDRSSYTDTERKSMSAMAAPLSNLDDLVEEQGRYFPHDSHEISWREREVLHCLSKHPSLTAAHGERLADTLTKLVGRGPGLDGRDYESAIALHQNQRCSDHALARYLEATRAKISGLFASWPENAQISVLLPAGHTFCGQLGTPLSGFLSQGTSSQPGPADAVMSARPPSPSPASQRSGPGHPGG